ncbi:hypothetical protein [Pinisolibacter aquiterrae]|uniref:hypothetical protein n=1 Tax=Pinisolibacter aquiterrae TaxID=2815579 RepID=UPI001C3D96F1|nr:hypothetical protein [Pinisolibacter aquiterrae]MBV5265573.1 hypothetical protein [Pinisolibacter aquiterrae]MCC8236860.1 hypothetical protein [Pinisolibacter aquiterrae]
MFDSYLIEIDDVEAGLLIRDGESYAFHAVAPRFRAFEGARFADPWSAERALRRHAERPTRPGGRSRAAGMIGPERPRDRKIG